MGSFLFLGFFFFLVDKGVVMDLNILGCVKGCVC